MTKFLIDSDILLDALLVRKPFYEDSFMLLECCEEQSIKCYVTPIIIANVHYLLSKYHSKTNVKKMLNNLISLVDMIDVKKSTFEKVLEKDNKDFEDALQFTAAEEAGFIDAIITRNKVDFKASILPVFTPNEIITQLTLR